jgi:hypothetical protein
VNKPKETFFDETDASRIDIRHIGFINGIFKMTDKVIINPAAYYTRMARASEMVIGMNAAYNLSGDGSKLITGGLFYRYGDAVIPMVGLQINNIRFTFSYDVTTSSLKNFNHSLGADEFNLLDKGFYNTFNGDRKQALCPVF